MHSRLTVAFRGGPQDIWGQRELDNRNSGLQDGFNSSGSHDITVEVVADVP